jgi:cholesterol 7-desaturase
MVPILHGYLSPLFGSLSDFSFGSFDWPYLTSYIQQHPLLSAIITLLVSLFLWLSASPSKCVRRSEKSPLQRKTGQNLPCPYPDAWYAIDLSVNVPPNIIKSYSICNRNIICWRPSATEPAVVMDAYCPHLGAHLGSEAGGRIESNCIRCPFHGWKFNSEGKCVSIGEETTSIPSNSSVHTYKSLEKNGVISIWLGSAEHERPGIKRKQLQEIPGKHGSKPWFNIPSFPELESTSNWVFHGYTEHTVNASFSEIPENGSDVAHLGQLHNTFIIGPLQWLFEHEWSASWVPRTAPEPFLVDIQVLESLKLKLPLSKHSWKIPGSDVLAKITQCGPSQVFLFLHTPFGRIAITETVTPINPVQLRVLHGVYAPPFIPRVIAKIILYATIAQFEKDIPVWNNKRYESKPKISKFDGPILQYRRWRQQFSSLVVEVEDASEGGSSASPTPASNSDEHSITFREAMQMYWRDTMGFANEASCSASPLLQW